MKQIRLLVCGGRDYDDRDFVFQKLDRIHRLYRIVRVVEGGARGADRLAAEWAISRGLLLLLRTYPADWLTHARRAGPIRNFEMLQAEEPNAVVAFPGGRGTADMIHQAVRRGITVWQPSRAIVHV